MAFDEADPRDTDPGDTPPPGLDPHPAWAAARAQWQRFRLMSDSVPVQMACESVLLHRLGTALPAELFVRELQRDGEPLHMVVARDIRDRQAARVRIQHLAEHDALTGLRYTKVVPYAPNYVSNSLISLRVVVLNDKLGLGACRTWGSSAAKRPQPDRLLVGLVSRAHGLVALLGRVLAREPLSPGTLALELPESLLVDDRHGLRRTVEQLAQLGLPVWLDDIGAGGAALADLRALLPACAPGVASGAQEAALRSVGCAMLQGPWYQPPMPVPEANAWLAAQAIRPAV